MEWIIGCGFLLAGIAWILYTGFATRCPMCGVYGLHQRDAAEEMRQQEYRAALEQTGMLDAMDQAGVLMTSRPRFGNRPLRCKRCGHAFDRQTAVIWLKTANKLGEYTAVSEYRKLRDETKAAQAKQ